MAGGEPAQRTSRSVRAHQDSSPADASRSPTSPELSTAAPVVHNQDRHPLPRHPLLVDWHGGTPPGSGGGCRLLLWVGFLRFLGLARDCAGRAPGAQRRVCSERCVQDVAHAVNGAFGTFTAIKGAVQDITHVLK